MRAGDYDPENGYFREPETALKNTLKKFHIDYIDLYLDHWPSGKDYRTYNVTDPFKPISIYDLWPKMEVLVEKGLTKSLGVITIFKLYVIFYLFVK